MRSSFLRIKKFQNFFRELVFQHYISKCRSFHLLHKFALIKYACHLVFSELLAGWNSVLSKYAGHLVFQKCSSAGILSTKYAGHLVFLELLTGRNSVTKMCQSFSFSVFTDGYWSCRHWLRFEIPRILILRNMAANSAKTCLRNILRTRKLRP